VGRMAGTLRVFCYAMAVSFVGALVAARSVYADFKEGSLRAGRELEALSDVLGGVNTVFVNGAAVHIATAFTAQAPAEVLDRFEAVCRAHPQFMARALADIPDTLLEKANVQADRVWRLGVVRHEKGDDGVLTCFTDERPAGMRDVARRLKAFEQSKDLSEFGHVRYVYVRRTDHGTHVRTIWTDGEVNLGKMFPAQGDAAGFDSTLVPRPPASTRILSGTSAQVPFGIHIYRSSEREESLRRFYDAELGARGWKPVANRTPHTVAYLKNGAMFFATLTPSGTRTLVTATETARGDTPTGAEVRVER